MYKLRKPRERTVCCVEGCDNLQQLRYTRRDGEKLYRKKCIRHQKTKAKFDSDYIKSEQRRRPYIKHKKRKCEVCDFVPVHPCQLDVDHIDGNHKNHTVDNLQTLCANCHRLKTYNSKDWEK